MQHGRENSMAYRLCTFALMAAIPAIPSAGTPAEAEESPAYVVEVSDVTAVVGEHQVMLATLKVRDGYRILQAYNNRVIALSSLDDGVVFDSKTVPATVQDGNLVFAVGLRPTKPGKHPINGIFRVGYIQGTSEMAMVSLRLIANVTGTQ